MLDNQFFPYGNKGEIFIIKRSIKIIKKIKKIYPIKIIIIACNTISTISLNILKKKFNIPIIGVLPSIKPAIHAKQNKFIGLIATPATINSKYVQKILFQHSNYNINVIATNKLAKIAEKKIRKNYINDADLRRIFYPWIYFYQKIDTIILGCTHFSILKKEIEKILKKKIKFIHPENALCFHIKKYSKMIIKDQKIKKNIFFYSEKNYQLIKLMDALKKYKFKHIKYINLN